MTINRQMTMQENINNKYDASTIKNELVKLKNDAVKNGIRVVEGGVASVILNKYGAYGMYYSHKLPKGIHDFDCYKASDSLFNKQESVIYILTTNQDPLDILPIFLHELIHLRHANIINRRENTIMKYQVSSNTEIRNRVNMNIGFPRDLKVDELTNQILGYFLEKGNFPSVYRILNDNSLYYQCRHYFHY